MNQPLDKGRVAFIAEKYQSQNGDKNRYATLGRATKWPGDNGGPENVTIELDSMPIGHSGPLNLFIFWDSQQQAQQAYGQPQQQQPAQYQQQPQQYQQQPQHQPGYGYQRK